MRIMRLLALILMLPIAVGAQAEQKVDFWEPLRFLEGSWEGQGDGMSGKSEVTQVYDFLLNGQFLQMRTRSVFEPQEKNPEGEIHEDMGVFSYDQARETFILRAFYIEGFVNTYVLSETSEDGKTLTFESEAVENAPPGTKARLIFQQKTDGELEQRFFVAFPGSEFSCFTTNQLKLQ